jgi:succinyl-CoA synthetase alpha subunit
MLIELEQNHAAVTLADSTRDLVEKTTALFGIAPDATATANHLAKQVEEALDARSRLGVTMDPRAWLTPDRTIESVFGIKERTRIGVLGFGRTAQFQLQVMKEHGARVCWAVTPNAGKYADSGIAGTPVFPTVKEAVAAGGDVDVVVNYAPAAHALDATRDCLEGSSQARLMILVAENLPYEKTIRTMDALEASGVACIGPNSPGVMIVDDRGGRPDFLKLGNMPPHLFEIAGGMSVVGRSGTVIFDIVERATATGIGTRMAWAIGGDKYTGLGFLEALVMLEQDPHTRFIVLGGESGGIQEQLAARLVATGIVSKPVIALVTGESLPAGVQCGHQGAVKFTEADDPSVKEQHLLAAGAIVVSNPTEVVAAIEQIERVGWNLDERRREALWGYLVDAGRITGFRWHPGLRPAYDLLYGLVGHYRIFDAQERTADHLHDLATQLAGVGIDRPPLLSPIQSGLRHGIRRAANTWPRWSGIQRPARRISPSWSRRSRFLQQAWRPRLGGGGLDSRDHEVGITETLNTIAKTVGARLFRRRRRRPGTPPAFEASTTCGEALRRATIALHP